MYSLRLVGLGSSVSPMLPDFQKVSVNCEFSDVGTTSFDYATGGINADLLTDQREIAVFDDIGEVPDTRFIIEESNGSRKAADGVVYRSYAGRNLWKMFDEALVYAVDWPTSAGTGERRFTAANAGAILSPLISKAQSLGELTGITFSFNSTADSAGAAWAFQLNIGYEMGITLLAVIQNLVDQGVIEVRMIGRQLNVYNAGTLGVDRTTGATPVVLWTGRTGIEAPEQRNSRDLRTVAIVKGDDNTFIEISDSTAVAAYGRRAMTVSQGGVKDTGTLTVIGTANLDRVKQPRSERTYRYSLGTESPVPMRSFLPGDYVFSDGVSNTPERMRVRQTVIEVESGNELGTCTVVLNDKFVELEIALNRRVAGITGGATAGGGSAAVPTNNTVVRDTLKPAAPAGLTVSSAAYVDAAGVTQAQVTASWAQVTQNTDGSACDDLAGYEVSWKYSTETPWRANMPTETELSTWSPLTVAKTVNVRVRAVDTNNNRSAWSSTVNVVTATDSTPPPVPSTPTVTNFLGLLRVVWNGLGSAGEAMSVDFKYVEVHVSTVNNFTPSASTQVDSLDSAGVAAVAGLSRGTPYFAKLIAVDEVKNKSAPSAQGTATPTLVVNSDVFDGAIGSSKLADLAVTTAKINLLAVNDAQIGNLSVGKLVAGSLVADITVSARIKTADTGARVELNSLGLKAYDGSNVLKVAINTDGTAMFSGTITGSDINGSAITGTTMEATSFATGAADTKRMLMADTASTSYNPALGRDTISWENVASSTYGVGPLVSYGSPEYGGGMALLLRGPQLSSQANPIRPFIQLNQAYNNTIVAGEGPFATVQIAAQRVLIQGSTRGQSTPSGTEQIIMQTGQVLIGSGKGVGGSRGVLAFGYANGLDPVGTARADGAMRIANTLVDAALRWESSGVLDVVNNAGTQFFGMRASAFTVSSDMRTKEEFAEPEVKSLDVIRQAPVTTWRRRSEPVDGMPVLRPNKHIGVVAQDLPEFMQRNMGAGSIPDAIGMDLADMIGVLWDAVRSLDTEMDQHRTKAATRRTSADVIRESRRTI